MPGQVEHGDERKVKGINSICFVLAGQVELPSALESIPDTFQDRDNVSLQTVLSPTSNWVLLFSISYQKPFLALLWVDSPKRTALEPCLFLF